MPSNNRISCLGFVLLSVEVRCFLCFSNWLQCQMVGSSPPQDALFGDANFSQKVAWAGINLG
jgi:hypothetical protein